MFEALQYEKDRNGGRLSPFGYSTFTVGAAVGDVKAMEVRFRTHSVQIFLDWQKNIVILISSPHGRLTNSFASPSGSTSCRKRAECNLVRKVSTSMHGDGGATTFK